MNIRNRMADVEKLRCNICQDFLKLIIQPGWQQVLYNKAKEEVDKNSKFKDKYIAAYRKMRDIGIDHYSIDDMDVTFIYEILSWGCTSVARAKVQTKNALKQLREDRNLNGHSSENETSKELYLRAFSALNNFKSFVQTVDDYETDIDNAKRLDYRQKYIPKIEELLNILYDEYIRSENIRKDIERILSGKLEWHNALKKYTDNYWKEEKDIYFEFLVRASDARIPSAHSLAADFFLTINNNPIEAEKRLQMAVESCKEYYQAREIIHDINACIKINGGLTTDSIKKLVDDIKAKGFLVELDSDGLYDVKKICKF